MKKPYYFLIAIALFVIFSIYKSFSDANQLKKDGEITIGKIIKFKHTKKSSYTYCYKYEVDGEIYEVNKASSYFDCGSNNRGCLGMNFQVIYSKSNPEISDIDLKANNKFKGERLYY